MSLRAKKIDIFISRPIAPHLTAYTRHVRLEKGHVASLPCRNRPTRSWRTLSVLASQRLFISLSGSFRQNGPRVLSRSPDIHVPACLSLRPKASWSSEVVLVSRSIAPWHFGFQHPPVPLAQLALRARTKAQVRRLVARRLTFFRMMISRGWFPNNARARLRALAPGGQAC